MPRASKRTIDTLSADDDSFPLYIRHPPIFSSTEELPSSLYVSEFDSSISPETWMLLEIKKRSFEGNNDPVSMIEAFMLAHKAKIYPPFWVLDKLCTYFEKYHDRQGKMGLDEIFKTSLKWFKTATYSEFYTQVALDVFRLRCLGLSLSRAAELVAIRLEHYPPANRSQFKSIKTKLEASTIEYKYTHGLAKKFDLDVRRKDHRYNPRNMWLKNQVEDFISKFALRPTEVRKISKTIP